MLWGNPAESLSLEKSRKKWDNISMDIKKIYFGNVDWIGWLKITFSDFFLAVFNLWVISCRVSQLILTPQ
jgi:hypothetical protein